MAKQNTLLNFNDQNEAILESIQNGILSEFPIETDKRILEISNIRLKDTIKDYDYPALKELKLNRGTHQSPLLADLILTDKETGRVIDNIKDFKIANVPKLTR
jgi:hypothetical protein